MTSLVLTAARNAVNDVLNDRRELQSNLAVKLDRIPETLVKLVKKKHSRKNGADMKNEKTIISKSNWSMFSRVVARLKTL